MHLPFIFIRLETNSGDKTDSKWSLFAFSSTTKLQTTSSHVFKLPISLNLLMSLNTLNNQTKFIIKYWFNIISKLKETQLL